MTRDFTRSTHASWAVIRLRVRQTMDVLFALNANQTTSTHMSFGMEHRQISGTSDKIELNYWLIIFVYLYQFRLKC